MATLFSNSKDIVSFSNTFKIHNLVKAVFIGIRLCLAQFHVIKTVGVGYK